MWYLLKNLSGPPISPPSTAYEPPGLFVPSPSVSLCFNGVPFFCDLWYALQVVQHFLTKGAEPMDWTTPQHEEIDLNCEVGSYANAEL